MPTFRDILTASDAALVKYFYKVKASKDPDFIKQISHAAAQLNLNHTQLVCALGFNRNIRDLTDVLSVVGFSSYKLLVARRNELFVNDTYRRLDIENVIDIYAAHVADDEILETLRELVIQRLGRIESKLAEADDAATMISYKMEVHSIYTSGIANAEFVTRRMELPIGDLRVRIGEMQMVADGQIVPPGNLFFSDYVMPAEKRQLIESGAISQAMVNNRLKNNEISEDERQMLEDFAG